MSQYWIYLLKNENWDKLNTHYSKNEFDIFSFTSSKIKENDYVLIYQKQIQKGKACATLLLRPTHPARSQSLNGIFHQ